MRLDELTNRSLTEWLEHWLSLPNLQDTNTINQFKLFVVLAGLFVDGFLKHQMARLRQLDRSLCHRTLSLQEFQVKNCLFLLKRKWKKVTHIIAAFSLAFCLFPRSGSLRGCGGAKARVLSLEDLIQQFVFLGGGPFSLFL
ncbi:uncharacterized protein G2W53_014202 [Senna tora]|uniref:Uncharacterized protein n=1 Tax=Senna tora TaxID=362788 RepID=A0A835C3S3_9FABA|nr:uncharacterized protein G2W53_014202 [Senna tora]